MSFNAKVLVDHSSHKVSGTLHSLLLHKAGLAHPTPPTVTLFAKSVLPQFFTTQNTKCAPVSVSFSSEFLSLLCHSTPACPCSSSYSDQTLAEFILLLYLLLFYSFECLSLWRQTWKHNTELLFCIALHLFVLLHRQRYAEETSIQIIELH